MSMTFYYLSGSPFSWKVWLALEHKELRYDIRVLSADAGDLKNAEFLAINPRGKVPVIDDGGFALCESTAIVEYLDDKFRHQGRTLWPQDIQARARARRIAAEADSYLYPPVRKLVVELLMRRTGESDQSSIDEAKSALTNEIARLGQLMTYRYIAGDEPSVADFALYPLMAINDRIDARRPEQGLRNIVPADVREWMTNIEALPYFSKTFPPHWRVL